MAWRNHFAHCGRAALLAALAACSAAWAAGPVKIYCCDIDGKRVCGDQLPPQCSVRSHREMSAGGTVKEVAAPLTAEQKAQLAAEKERKKKEDERLAEQKRRDAALLATYASEKDIDVVRDKQVAEAQKMLQQAEKRHAEALKQQKRLANEAEFYRNKSMPPKLASQIKENQAEITGQETAMAARKQDIEEIRARFEEEKKRYLELTSRQTTTGGH